MMTTEKAEHRSDVLNALGVTNVEPGYLNSVKRLTAAVIRDRQASRHDTAARISEPASDGRPDSRSATGDQRCLAGEIKH